MCFFPGGRGWARFVPGSFQGCELVRRIHVGKLRGEGHGTGEYVPGAQGQSPEETEPAFGERGTEVRERCRFPDGAEGLRLLPAREKGGRDKRAGRTFSPRPAHDLQHVSR